MKPLEMLALLAAAVAVLLGVLGAGSASATVLCKENKDPCLSKYPLGTVIKGELMSGNMMVWTGVGDTCKKSTFSGEVTNSGGVGSTVVVKLTSLTWSECGRPHTAVKLGSLELHWQEGGYGGGGRFIGTEWKDGFCTYAMSSEVQSGLIESTTSTSHAVFDVISAAGVGNVFGCLGEVQRWDARYTVTAPVPLWVSSS
ncbi:MAG TPA: hypothetical protein VKB23_12960 [Solirubrobacterales bacterium]|nr:hypothetical protein [Solirubrobacterales bacterium]